MFATAWTDPLALATFILALFTLGLGRATVGLVLVTKNVVKGGSRQLALVPTIELFREYRGTHAARSAHGLRTDW